MFDRAWQIPQARFVTAWTQANTLDEAAVRIRELAGACRAGPSWRGRWNSAGIKSR